MGFLSSLFGGKQPENETARYIKTKFGLSERGGRWKFSGTPLYGIKDKLRNPEICSLTAVETLAQIGQDDFCVLAGEQVALVFRRNDGPVALFTSIAPGEVAELLAQMITKHQFSNVIEHGGVYIVQRKPPSQ